MVTVYHQPRCSPSTGVLCLEAVYTEEVEEKEEMQVDGESSEPPKKKKGVKKNPVACVPG
jgi:hypothetical protein